MRMMQELLFDKKVNETDQHTKYTKRSPFFFMTLVGFLHTFADMFRRHQILGELFVFICYARSVLYW